MLDFWKRVESILKSRDMRMADLSRHCDISPSTLCNWKRYDRYPSARYADKIASILGVSVEWLISGNDIYADDEPDFRESAKATKLINTIKTMDESQLAILEPLINYMVTPEHKRKRRK